MKIACNTRLFLPGTLEGVARFSYEVISRMVLNHPEDEFIFIHDRPVDNQYKIAENITHISTGPQARHPLLWYWWFEKSTGKVLHKFRPDVYFSPELYCCLTSAVPTMSVCHDLAYAHYPHHIPVLERKYLNRFVPRFVKRAEKIGCVSQSTQQDVMDKTGVDGKKTVITYNGPTPGFKPLDPENIEQVKQEITSGAPYFIYIGSMHPRKNMPNMVKAYNLYRKKYSSSILRLVLVGRYAWKSDETKTAIDSSPYREDIIILGERSDAPRLVGGADALLYVSLLEGFGIPILEAYSCGIPVITSSSSSMPEVAGKGGLIVDPLDPIEIAEAMYRINNPELRSSLIVEGRKQLDKYSWDKTAEKVYDSLKEISS